MACVLIVAFYFWKCHDVPTELGQRTPDKAYYNLLVDGFRSGQLNLKVETPPELLKLPDPWDPAASLPFRKGVFFPERLHDTSYFRGKIYLYFSPVPVLLLFWPYRALTGHYLDHNLAVAVFCSAGFLIAAGVWRAFWRRYCSHLSVGFLVAGVVALGTATGVPMMMIRPEIWEIPISTAYAFSMAGGAALWCALHEPAKLGRWVAVASGAFAIAVAARPSFLLSTPVLLLPVIAGWQDLPAGGARRRKLVAIMAAMAAPLLAVGLALSWYNYARFGNALEFGQHYQLASDRQDATRHFSAAYFWFNFRLYFLSWAPWSATFPYIQAVAIPPLPAGHGDVDLPYGILVNTPVTLFALAAPLAWRIWPSRAQRGFLAVAGAMFLSSAVLMCLFYGTCTRYEVEFAPMLTLLGAVGAAALATWLAGRSAARIVTTLLGATVLFSATFSALKGNERRLEQWLIRARALVELRDYHGALTSLEKARRYDPAHQQIRFTAGLAYHGLGDIPRALASYEEAIRLAPDDARARDNLGRLLDDLHRYPEAAQQLREAIRIRPNDRWLHFNLGLVLQHAGDHAKAIECFQNAQRLGLDHADVHLAGALSLRALGRVDEARRSYAQARRLRPELPDIEL